MSSYTLEPIGFIRSTVKGREDAPRQGPEGAPDAWLEIEPQFAEALLGMEVGHELIIITWLHQARRDVLKGHPRSDESRPLTGVFYTRSPARPNPLGLHPVTVREIDGARVKIGPIEVFDGTPCGRYQVSLDARGRMSEEEKAKALNLLREATARQEIRNAETPARRRRNRIRLVRV